ncbi:hypothetical protein TUSST3_63370 [Streptomyces sp. TUS-ST3]|nr:hypothetical protein TUSST3_63370 [Streptomyces sp. TUS-ST3]
MERVETEIDRPFPVTACGTCRWEAAVDSLRNVGAALRRVPEPAPNRGELGGMTANRPDPSVRRGGVGPVVR